ncbi:MULTISPECIES: polysaccharide deacetylase family protein [Streptomyces]|uniref:Polysaccharide deacetylase family protein n=1 Tax=Streptomyces lonegramiae TaxID=3075524 RepID=A0ABU2X8J6_9ACTN|nr:polysaccharide deacetylase family protein [Streptomyces sp. DSM 41529]MDT0541875.1 polysaccharide deacetylase family protein [Streptomyces sp. DSM 41529]
MLGSARNRIRIGLIAAATAAMAALSVGPSPAATPGEARGDAAWANCPNGYVGLTYDDGPNPSSTQALLTALRAGGAKATFFIWGQHAEQYPDLLRAEQAAGMWIANHTATHAHLTQIGEPAAYHEIATAQSTIQRITGQAPTLFRPPYGETNAQVKSDAARLGLTEVLWNVDSQDWNGAGTQQIVQAAATLRAGGIILMHDGGYQSTVGAVPQILSGLAARGLCPGRITAGAGGTAVVTAP